MKILLTIVLMFFIVVISNGQNMKYKIINIDSINNKYVIKIQSIKNSKFTIIYTRKYENKFKSKTKIKVGDIYCFSFVNKYVYGNPNFQLNEDGSGNYVVFKSKFKKNNKDESYSVNELKGLFYLEN